MITSSPEEFADALRRVGNESEVIVLLKDPAVPPMAGDFLRELPLGENLVVGVRDVPAGAPQRRTPGLARAGAAAQEALLRVLRNHGVEPYRTDTHALALRIPDETLVPVLAVLLHHPSVDYVEANQRRPISFNAGPVGSNPYDIKHSFHDILGAWDYTRGAGAKVGILDSGYANDRATNQWHPDGQLLSSTRGIQMLGFGDDYDNYINCDGIGSQPYGNCVPWDDHGHGTRMAGLVGANDNNIGYVGVMPEGLTVSMKIAQNCAIASGCGGSNAFVIEDDDFYWGVKWASNNGVQVLSMSFSANHGWNSSVYNALYDAYYTYDILLLSSVDNDKPDNVYPQTWPFVMGVGGVTSSGGNVGLDAHQEVSGLAGGWTTAASCPSIYQFCTPSGYIFSGGTSTATAITAGIAGLLRAYSPTLTAPQVRQRLINTSSGPPHYVVDARAAILNQLPLSATISGPSFVDPYTSATWSASLSGGTSPYTYRWYRDGTQVSTASSYTGSNYGLDFQLRLDVTDAASRVKTVYRNVSILCEGAQPVCPEVSPGSVDTSGSADHADLWSIEYNFTSAGGQP